MIPKTAATVLVIDDEPDICWALAHVLKGMGVLAAPATSGEEALRLIEVRRFDLAFVDAKLGDLNGLDVAVRIRACDSTVPIILISGYFYDDDAEVRQAMAAGLIAGFISKPILHEEVLTITRRLLSHS